MLRKHADKPHVDFGGSALKINVAAALRFGPAVPHVPAADPDRRGADGTGNKYVRGAADRYVAAAGIQAVLVEIFRPYHAARKLDISVDGIHARHLPVRLQTSAANRNAIADGQTALSDRTDAVYSKRAAFQREVSAFGKRFVGRIRCVITHDFRGMRVDIRRRALPIADRQRAFAPDSYVAVIKQQRRIAAARPHIDFVLSFQHKFSVALCGERRIGAVARRIIYFRARKDLSVFEDDLRRAAVLRGNIDERSFSRLIFRFSLRGGGDKIHARFRNVRRTACFGAGAFHADPRREKGARGEEQRREKPQSPSFAIHTKILLCFGNKKEGFEIRNPLFQFYFCYFFMPSSTATAMATDAPTIGLLPMPISPIISTCAGTEEEPANCASECILPMVSVMP